MRAICTILPLFALALLVGCGGKNDPKKAGGHDHGDHDHGPEAGPHGGLLAVIGEHEYHYELAHDDKTNKVTIYFTDKDAKKPEPVEGVELVVSVKAAGGETKPYTLAAAPESGETGGKSSRFELVDEALAKAIDTKGTTGTFSVKMGGKPRLVQFKGGETPDHDHDHGKEKK